MNNILVLSYTKLDDLQKEFMWKDPWYSFGAFLHETKVKMIPYGYAITLHFEKDEDLTMFSLKYL